MMTDPLSKSGELPEYVVVPGHPITTGDGREVRFELRESDSGERAGIAFTSVAELIAQLGRFQPWMVMRSTGLRNLLAAAGVKLIVLDPEIDPTSSRWSQEAIDALVEVNDGRL